MWSTSERLVVEILTIGAIQVPLSFLFLLQDVSTERLLIDTMQWTVREWRRDWWRRQWYSEMAGDEMMVRETNGLYSHIWYQLTTWSVGHPAWLSSPARCRHGESEIWHADAERAVWRRRWYGVFVFYCCFTHLEQFATLRHFSTISTDFEEEAEAIFVQQQFPILICYSL